MPWHLRDLRERKGGYNGARPIQLRWRDPTDPRIRREQSFASKREARAQGTEWERDANHGVWVDPHLGRETLAAVAAEWLEGRSVDTGPKTRLGYESILNAHVLPEFGQRRIAGIDPADVDRWIRKLVKAGKAPHTIHSIYTVFRMLMNFAVERKRIAASPCIGVRLPPKRQEEPQALDHAQVRLLAEAMPDDMTRVAVLTAAYMGLRAGELWALKRDDLNLLKRTLRVDESLKEVTTRQAANLPHGFERINKTLILGPPKTPAAMRTLSIPEFLVDELAALMGKNAPGAHFIFTVNGEPVKHNTFYKRVFVPSLPTELTGTTWHTLRHTCASLLINDARERGLNDPEIIAFNIAKYLGHNSVVTTLQIYSHMLAGSHEALAASMDRGYRQAARPSPVARLRAT